MPMYGVRAKILHFPQATGQPELDYAFWENGLLVIKDGVIEAVGDADQLLPAYPNLNLLDHTDHLLLPGFIDSHVHFPQTEMIASYGKQLLDWLNQYTFPTEAKFADPDYAEQMAPLFLNELLKSGTTTALAYASVHPQSVDALFAAAAKLNMRFISGKVCMDRRCPENLQDSPESAQQQSADLILRWHNKGRLAYAITPRFAPTSSPRQLQLLGELAKQYPDTFIQTHLSENHDEIAWVRSLYPDAKGYLDVYDRVGLVRERAVFGHCLHLQDAEWQLLAERNASIAFCPSSNLFLGSGLMDIARAKAEDVHLTLATDVGAGTSFNLLHTLGEGYKVAQLGGHSWHPLAGLYSMTQGAANALGLADEIGNLNPGSAADFVLLNPSFSELSRLRLRHAQTPADIVFALSMLADERCTAATYVAGEQLYSA